MSPSELAEAIDKAVQAAQNAAHSVGETKQENRNSESITQKVKKTAEAKKRESGKQHGNSAKSGNSANNGSQNASGKGGGDTISHERGASSGKADLSAAKLTLTLSSRSARTTKQQSKRTAS